MRSSRVKFGRVRESFRLLAEALGDDALAEGLLVSANRRVSLISALVATGLVDELRLESVLGRAREPALPAVADLRPVLRLVDALPPNLCDRLLALPIGQDGATGTIEVAVVDGADVHGADEIAYWLNAPVRVVRASLTAMTRALRDIEIRPPPPPDAPRCTAEEGEQAPSSGVPTQRGPFQQSAGAEEAVSTKRGH